MNTSLLWNEFTACGNAVVLARSHTDWQDLKFNLCLQDHRYSPLTQVFAHEMMFQRLFDF